MSHGMTRCNESCDHLLVNLPSFLKECWCSTNLRVYTNECICSVVELFLQRNHNALELVLRLLTNVSCNLRNITQYKKQFRKLSKVYHTAPAYPKRWKVLDLVTSIPCKQHCPTPLPITTMSCTVLSQNIFCSPPYPQQQKPKQTHKNNLCPVLGRSFIRTNTHNLQTGSQLYILCLQCVERQ